MLEMRNLRGPIGTVPIDDYEDDDDECEEPSSESDPQPQAPNPLAQLADATDPLEVEIDLRAEDEDATQYPAIPFTDTPCPNQNGESQDCCTVSSPDGG